MKDEQGYESVISAHSFLQADHTYNFTEVTSENVDEFDLLGEKQLIFNYLKSDTNLSYTEIDDFCKAQDRLDETNNMCTLVQEANIQDFFIDDIDEYIAEQLANVEDGQVDFSKLILALIIPR